MADHLTEEEQIETIKRWWKENWFSIVLPIMLAALAYTGWNWWENKKLQNAQIAAAKYQGLLEAVSPADGAELSPEAIQTATTLAISLSDEHQNTMYADLADLILARLSVEAGSLDAAAAQLNKVVENGQTPAIKSLATGRLARVYLAQEKFTEALALLDANKAESMTAIYSEIRGDILLEQGDVAAANAEYTKAMESSDPSQFARNSLLQLKLNATEVEESEEAADETAQVEAESAEVEEVESAE